MNKTETFLLSNGLHYHVESSGETDAPVLFALHGFSESLETWDALDLPDWQIIKIDLIGHGQSEKPEMLEHYQLPEILSALHEIIEHYRKSRPFVLLGYSMGGRIALNYALKFPKKISKLVLESASLGLDSSEVRQKRRLADEALANQIEAKGSEWFADFWGSQDIFKSQKNLPLEMQDKIWHMRAANLPYALANSLRATGQGNLAYLGDKINQLKMPVLYLYGELDIKYAKTAQSLPENVRALCLSGCGHNTHLENAALFSKILQKELKKC